MPNLLVVSTRPTLEPLLAAHGCRRAEPRLLITLCAAGGTYGNATGLIQESQCLAVYAEYWAPVATAIPKLCPASGFICPGAAQDTVSEVPGSEPVLVAEGGTSEEVTETVTETQTNYSVTT